MNVWEAVFAVAMLVINVVTSVLCYRLGYHFGEQSTINRLIDAKDSDAWVQAHIIRANKKNEETASSKTPNAAFAAVSDAEAALAPTRMLRKWAEPETTETNALVHRKKTETQS